MEEVRIGRITFRQGLGKQLSLPEFQRIYGERLKGIDIEKAWQQLGGTIEKPKKQKEDAGKVE